MFNLVLSLNEFRGLLATQHKTQTGIIRGFIR